METIPPKTEFTQKRPMFLKVSEDGFMVKILLSVAIFAKNV